MLEIPAWATRGLEFKTYYIGSTFPGVVDFPAKLALETKERNSKVIGSDIALTAEEQAQAIRTRKISADIWEKYRDFKRLDVLPSELWYFSPPLPGNLPVFRITGGGVVVSSACAEVLQRFRLGESRLQEVQIYHLGNKKPIKGNPYFFVNISEWRNFLVPEASDPRCKYIGYERNGYKMYGMLFFESEIEQPAYALKADVLHSDVDLWHDPMLMGSFFLSEPLQQALQDAGMADAWYLQACRLA